MPSIKCDEYGDPIYVYDDPASPSVRPGNETQSRGKSVNHRSAYEHNKAWRQRNPDKYREAQREYMRRYRANGKASAGDQSSS